MIRIGLLLLAIPIATLAILMPVNEYRAQGLDAVDCDGPLNVMIVAVPALMIVSAGAFIMYRRRHGRMIAGLCLLVAIAIGANLFTAVLEMRRNGHAVACTSPV